MKDESCGYANWTPWFFMLLIAAVIMGGFYLMMPTKTEGSNVYITNNGSAVEHNTISTTGSANEKVDPDMLTISFVVESEGTTASEAQAKNSKIAADAISALKALGVNEKDIKTVSYSVDVKRESHYICSNESGKSDCYWSYVDVGYTASHAFSVDMYNFDKSGEAIDALGKTGANVQGVSFGLKPETRQQVVSRLLCSAAGEAKKKAESIASGVGANVVKTLSISESYSYSPMPYYAKDYVAMAASAPTTPIESGSIYVSVSVSAVFEIK